MTRLQCLPTLLKTNVLPCPPWPAAAPPTVTSLMSSKSPRLMLSRRNKMNFIMTLSQTSTPAILLRRGPSFFTMATPSSSTTVLMLSRFRNYFFEPPLPTFRRFRTPSSRKAIGFWHISAPFFSPRVDRRLSLPHARLWTDMLRLVLPALVGVRLLRRLPRSAPLQSLDFFDPPPHLLGGN